MENGQRPSHPGVYAVFVKRADCLRGIGVPPNGLLYIGYASNLGQRNHFLVAHSGFNTLRRSIGAILKSDLGLAAIRRGSGPSASNYGCYRFTDDGEARLSRWMIDNLDYSDHRVDGDLRRLEAQLIREHEPPLNLTGWPNPQKRSISALRKGCSEEARLSGPD